MQVFAINKVSTFVKSTSIRAFHYEIFHGHCERGGISYPHERNCRIGDDYREPLHIWRSGTTVPPIFSPSNNWIVSRSVRDRLAGLPNIEFLPVVFEKLYAYDLLIGNFAWYDAPTCDRPEDLFKCLPDIPQLHEHVGPYYEVLVARLIDLVPYYEGWQALSFDIGTAPNEWSVETPMSRAVFRDHAIVWGNCSFLRGDAHERIEQYLNPYFFNVMGVTLE
jgi:hypothetical protein